VAVAAESGGRDVLDLAKALGQMLGDAGLGAAPGDVHPAALGKDVEGIGEVVGGQAGLLQQRADAHAAAAAVEDAEDEEGAAGDGRGLGLIVVHGDSMPWAGQGGDKSATDVPDVSPTRAGRKAAV